MLCFSPDDYLNIFDKPWETVWPRRMKPRPMRPGSIPTSTSTPRRTVLPDNNPSKSHSICSRHKPCRCQNSLAAVSRTSESSSTMMELSSISKHTNSRSQKCLRWPIDISDDSEADDCEPTPDLELPSPVSTDSHQLQKCQWINGWPTQSYLNSTESWVQSIRFFSISAFFGCQYIFLGSLHCAIELKGHFGSRCSMLKSANIQSTSLNFHW